MKGEGPAFLTKKKRQGNRRRAVITKKAKLPQTTRSICQIRDTTTKEGKEKKIEREKRKGGAKGSTERTKRLHFLRRGKLRVLVHEAGKKQKTGGKKTSQTKEKN